MFLHILSAASEYNELPVRHNEVFLIMCSPYLYPDYLYILIECDKFERNKLYIIYETLPILFGNELMCCFTEFWEMSFLSSWIALDTLFSGQLIKTWKKKKGPQNYIHAHFHSCCQFYIYPWDIFFMKCKIIIPIIFLQFRPKKGQCNFLLIIIVLKQFVHHKLILFKFQWALAQMTIPPPLIMGWRVRLWFQDSHSAYVTYWFF